VLSRFRLNSDRGSNYTSAQFAKTLQKHDLRHSAGRTGICYDNAMAESFFAALKNERVHRTEYPTREHARRDAVTGVRLEPVVFWPAGSASDLGGRVPGCRYGSLLASGCAGNHVA
jgi:hypothetical protein